MKNTANASLEERGNRKNRYYFSAVIDFGPNLVSLSRLQHRLQRIGIGQTVVVTDFDHSPNTRIAPFRSL
jgi:hypothetical protein